MIWCFVFPCSHAFCLLFLLVAQWYTSVREKLCDPAYEGWFLKFSPEVLANHTKARVPVCDANYDPPKCSVFYHDQEQTPQHPHGDGSCTQPCDCGCVPCGEYLWDHRNQSLRTWLVEEHLTGPTSLDHSTIDGIFTDGKCVVLLLCCIPARHLFDLIALAVL